MNSIYEGLSETDVLKTLIQAMIEPLVDNTDEIQININEGSGVTIYELHINKKDIGKVIGKQGQNVRSIRHVVNSAATRLKKRVLLEIVE